MLQKVRIYFFFFADQKTLCEMEKMLTSFTPFSKMFLKVIFLRDHQNFEAFGKGINLFQTILLLTHSLIHHFEIIPNSKKLQTTTEMSLLTLKLLITTHRPFADNVDQDQTAENVQSDLGSMLSDKEIVLSKK